MTRTDRVGATWRGRELVGLVGQDTEENVVRINQARPVVVRGNTTRRSPVARYPVVVQTEGITATLGPTSQAQSETEYAALIAGKNEIKFRTPAETSANKGVLSTWGVSCIDNPWGNATSLRGGPWPKNGDDDFWLNGGLAFWLDGDEITFAYADNTTNAAVVFVDGYAMTGADSSGKIANAVASSGNAKQWVRLVMPENRRWLVYIHRATIGAIVIKKTATLRPVEFVGKAMVFGDSFAKSQIATGEVSRMARPMASAALESLGWDVVDCATGGTGFVADAGGVAQGKGNFSDYMRYLERVARPKGWDPEDYSLIWLWASGNDSGVTVEQYRRVIGQALALFPNAEIVVSSVYEGFNTPAQAASRNDVLKLAVDQSPDRVIWLPLDSKYHPTGQGLFTGSGSVPAPAGDGNADLYLSNAAQGAGDRHPNREGALYGANWLASELVARGVAYSSAII